MTPHQLALAEWLEGHDYRTFATWTFGKAWPLGPSPEAVRRHVLPWVEQVCRGPAFVVAECGTSGQRRWHAHGLLGPTELPLPGLWGAWFRRYGRCRFEPLRPDGEGVRLYVAKYCVKSSPHWWIKHGAMFDA